MCSVGDVLQFPSAPMGPCSPLWWRSSHQHHWVPAVHCGKEFFYSFFLLVSVHFPAWQRELRRQRLCKAKRRIHLLVSEPRKTKLHSASSGEGLVVHGSMLEARGRDYMMRGKIKAKVGNGFPCSHVLNVPSCYHRHVLDQVSNTWTFGIISK